MAASEVTTSLVIDKLQHRLSEREILSSGLPDQINTAVSHLQTILTTLKLLQSGTDNDQQSGDHGSGLLGRAQDAADCADKFLLGASRHLMSRKGRLMKLYALVRFMSLRIRVRPSGRKELDFITRVQKLSTHLSQMQDLPPYDLFTLEENASSRNTHRGNVRWNGKVESDIVGREDEECELVARLTLKDGDQDALRLCVIPVVGEEAIGKTALVRSVYNRLEIDHSFQCRVWVHVPKKFALKDLLVEILKQTPVQELKEHKKNIDLKEILHKTLMELRYLIVFDDLQDARDMDVLMNLLLDSRNGSRVIITTRDPEIPSIIDHWASPLELHQLDADQSELLLKQCGSISEDSGLKASILSKCSGSPPRILLLGGLAAASSHSSPAMVDQLADNPTLCNIVSLSYHKLPNLLKPCLLYLCLFPKDSDISMRRLFRLWHAEGLVPVLEFTAMECFEELVGRNLVHVVRRRKQSEKPKSCRVPSFLHDFLCEMATRLALLQIHSDTKGPNHGEESKLVNGCSWIVKHQESQKSAETGDHCPGNIHLRHIRSYVTFKTQKQGTRSREVEELLRPLISKGDCGLLRVLDLERTYKPLLPDELGNVLLNLRYLGLRWTVLDSIPESVGNMSRLETLDLKHTNVSKLPSSIWKVKSLQHLYMNEVCFDKSTSGGSLSNLQTLWGLFIGSAKSPMLDVLRKLTRLEKLGLTCDSPVMKKATECILKLTKLECLKLRSRDVFGQPSDLNLSDMSGVELISDLYLLGSLPKRHGQDVLEGLPQQGGLELLPRNLKILTLSMSGLDADSMPVLAKLEGLEMLNFFAGSYTGKELDFRVRKDSFPRLRILKLWKLEKVRKAYVDETSLCCLEDLEIKNCGLTSIDSLNHIESLKQISLIKVKEELATNMKATLTAKLFINGKQLATSRSSREVFIKEKQLVPPPPPSAQKRCISAALSSGVVVKRMQVMPVFSSRFRELWEEWELRGLVLLSLTLQILLICMGNRRKYIHSALLRAFVWLAYLMADSVAIYALGIITNKLTKLNSQSVDADTQLNAFWAPFLLLHLGGPDTITAYALEDNELWLRHLLALVTQAGVTFYIFLMAWTARIYPSSPSL
ncbi:putative disease resistance RPP13-like protein 2 [Eucalyptus grandis]|uniref:putative disease resistance RPP13-like protein 2 n=1 Tax=Eucalyptus grandis TaxID=71139 RepID=UPI00192EC12E|nr:putative disease resistance RPP13-like protein 2 [Eucalyptus grandis]